MLSTEESTCSDVTVVEDANTTVNAVESTESHVDDKRSLIVNETNYETGKKVEINEEESADEAAALLEQGKHLLSINDYVSAESILLSACLKFCKIYGDLSDECGDAYFYYGCTLLELAKSSESQAIQNRKQRKSIKDSKAAGDTKEAECFKRENDNGNSENDTTQVNCSESRKVPSGDCVEKMEESPAEEKIQEKNNVWKEETMVPADEISDGQLANEILKLAEFIFLRQNDELKLMDIYSKLSETDMFLKNFSDAVVHCQKCLTHHEKQSNLAEKEIAQTLHQLGEAYLLSKQYYAAVKHFTSAGVVLEQSIRHLLRSAQSYEDTDPRIEEIDNEVDEVRKIVQTIKDKICDVEDLIRESMRSDLPAVNSNTIKESNGNTKLKDPVNGSSISEMQANVIAHLLRRKRKLVLNNGSILKKRRLDTN